MADASNTVPQSDAKIRHILAEAIYRQKPLFWTTLLLILALTVVAILVIPKRYQADAKIMVQNLRSQPNLSTDNISKVVTSDDVTETQMNSEVDLLQSQAVMRRALHLPATSAGETAAQATADELLIKQTSAHLTVEPVRLSSIINLRFTADSPKDATDQLNQIINAYFDERAALARSTGAAEFFSNQTEQFGHKLDEARAELTQFEAQHDFVNLDDQKKLEAQRIAALDDTIDATRAHLADQNGRSRTLLTQLAHTDQRTETTRRLLTNQYSQEHLNTDLVDLKNQRTQLADRYQASDRALQELDQKILTTQDAIKEATQHPAAESASDINPIWQQVQSLLIQANADISGTVAQQNELLRQRKDAQTRLHELLDATGAYDQLNRQFQEVQSDYNIYVQKRDEARVGEALDREKMFDVSVVLRPNASLTPVRPKPIPYFAAGLLLALFLSAALALYADSSAERIYSPQQLDHATRTRTLATISQLDSPGRPSALADLPAESLLEYSRLLYTLRAAVDHDRGLADLPIEDGQPSAGELAGYSFAFTAALPGEGVSYVIRNLAIETVKHTNAHVALLDIKLLQHQVQTGGPITVWLALNHDSACWEFHFGPSLPSRTDGIKLGDLHGQRIWSLFAELFDKIRHEFTYIFLDCPSIRESTVSVELESIIDGYVIIVAAGMVRKRQVDQAASLLKQTRTPLLGFVLNRRTYPVPQWLYRVLW